MGRAQGNSAKESGFGPATPSTACDAPQDTWKPIGSLLERFFAWLDYTPQSALGDPQWKPRQVRAGDTVEIATGTRLEGERVLDRATVVAAISSLFKLADGRVFDQRGWPLFSGAKSPVRARREASSPP